jgi:hypothetical protein
MVIGYHIIELKRAFFYSELNTGMTIESSCLIFMGRGA